MAYTILRFEGDYKDRNARIKEAGAELSLHQHLNSVSNPTANHALAKYLRAGPPSQSLAVEYARTVADRCPCVTNRGPRVVAMFNGLGSTDESRRGLGNLRGLRCPAALLEPGFVSNPYFAAWAKSPAGVACLAGVIVHIVQLALPHGGVVALCVGHAGKTSNPHDRGVAIHGGGWEADLAGEIVGEATARLLASSVGSVVIT